MADGVGFVRQNDLFADPLFQMNEDGCSQVDGHFHGILMGHVDDAHKREPLVYLFGTECLPALTIQFHGQAAYKQLGIHDDEGQGAVFE